MHRKQKKQQKRSQFYREMRSLATAIIRHADRPTRTLPTELQAAFEAPANSKSGPPTLTVNAALFSAAGVVALLRT